MRRLSTDSRNALVFLTLAVLLGALAMALYLSRPGQSDPAPTRPTVTPAPHPTAMPQASLWNQIEKTTHPRGR